MNRPQFFTQTAAGAIASAPIAQEIAPSAGIAQTVPRL